jgi:hypothetical protein
MVAGNLARSRPSRSANPICKKASRRFKKKSTPIGLKQPWRRYCARTWTRHDDARSLLRAIYSTEVDIVPDLQANTLTIRLHPLANTSSDLSVRHLCAKLNTTETLFPGTELRLIYDLVSSKTL